MSDSLVDAQLQAGHAQAWFVGSRIDVRELERGETVAVEPLTVRAGEKGYAMLFRYGVVVLINLTPQEEQAYLDSLRPLITSPFEAPETERVAIARTAGDRERIEADGTLRLRELSLPRLHVVAHVLAKSAVLSYYEESVAGTFDQIERLADRLQRGAWRSVAGSDLMHQIGNVLLAQTQTVGRVEVTEKPEITWDHPELDRLYERLSLEYELRDRDVALTRKLDFISKTAQTYLDLLQARQSIRVEWYIVLLIVVEIVLILYDLFG